MKDNNFVPPQITLSAAGNNIYYKNKYLYPEKNPLNRIESKIDALDITENTLIIVPSPLLYYGIHKLQARLKKNCHVIFLEQDKYLFNISDNPYPEFESFYAGCEHDINDLCLNFDFSNYRKVLLLPLNSGYFINRTFYNNAADIFRKTLNTFWKNKITMISLSSRWYSNIFKNLPVYFNSSSLSDLKFSKPVFVAGAGESLEKALPLIKKYKDEMIVIVIDTAVNTLLHYDIKPDYILAVESQFYNIFDFYGCRDSGIPVICDISAYPETCRITGGRNYFFFSEFAKSSFLKYLYSKKLLPVKIPPLGSVGVIAVYIANMLTKSAVIYSGLDFSFIPGKSHSKDSPFTMLTSLLRKKTDTDTNYSFCLRGEYFKTTDLAGKKVYSNRGLQSYSNTLSEITSGSGRIYSLFKAGISYNKNVLNNENEFAQLLNRGTEELKSVNIGSEECITEENNFYSDKITDQTGTEDNKISVLIDFYENEYNNLKIIIKNSVDILYSNSNDTIESELKTLLQFSDYITDDFPESMIPEQLTATYIKRLLLSCYRYERILSQIIERLKY